MSELAYSKASIAFNKARTSVAKAVRIAIDEYRRVDGEQKIKTLQITIADTPLGPDTALVITGFENTAAIYAFIQETFYASGK